MRLFFRYLRYRRRGIIAAFLCALIFSACFALYRLPLMAVVYPALLCAVLAAVFALFDFLHLKRRYGLLRRLEAENLPTPESLTEEALIALIADMARAQSESRAEAKRRYSDMLDYFTAWAHQIKTPIASMQLALGGEDSASARRLRGELTRVEQYVEMVLGFLRLGSDSSDYVLREYELDGIVRRAVKKFSHEFIDRRLSLSYEPIEARIVTDEKWLGFVIEQVLSNALKYTRAGGITISLEDMRLSIADTGIGIAPEDLPRIFEKGFTGLNGRSDMKASGIGLWLCRSICDRLGIAISASSVLDEGTVIVLDLRQKRLEVE